MIWYRNNVPLKNSREFLLTFDGQRCILVKDRCEKENDSGTYRLTAVNSMGQAESTCQVVVQSNKTILLRERIQSARSMPPLLVQALEGQTIEEGQRLLLRVCLDGQPKPQVTWLKDNQSIQSNQNYQVVYLKFKKKQSILIISIVTFVFSFVKMRICTV